VDLTFLEACFRQGLLEFWDGVSVHPSRDKPPELVEEDYRRLRVLLRRYVPANRFISLIASGGGYSSAAPALGQDVDTRERTQATYFSRQILGDVANDIALSIWSDWRDDSNRSGDGARGSGIVQFQGVQNGKAFFRQKPACTAMKTLVEQLKEYRFNKRLQSWNSEEDYMLLFERNRDVRVAVWTVRQRPEHIGLPVSPGTLNMIGSDGRTLFGSAPEEKRTPFGLKFVPRDQVMYMSFAEPNILLQMAASATRLPLEYVFTIPGSAPEVNFGFKNVSGQAVVARFTSETNRDDEKWTILDGKKDVRELAAEERGETRIAATSSALNSSRGSLMLGIELTPNGNFNEEGIIPISQRVHLVASNPLTVTRMPGNPDEVVVKIENTGGALWQGPAEIREKARKKVLARAGRVVGAAGVVAAHFPMGL
jgi:hypothetical protein